MAKTLRRFFPFSSGRKFYRCQCLVALFQLQGLLMSPKPKDARRKPSRVMTDGKTPETAKKKKSQTAAQSKKVTKSGKKAKPPKIDLDQLGELPRHPSADRIFLIARDPHLLYCYWDIDISRHPGGPTYLRTFVGSEESPEAELPVTFESRGHELPARQAGSRYTVELGYLRGTQWNCLARSATVETPPDHMAEAISTTFSTLAWPSGHASTRRTNPSDQFAPPLLAELPQQYRRILEMLLGEDLLDELSSASFSSEEISSRIHLHLEELLSSGSASELLARIPGALATISSSSEDSAHLPTLTASGLTRWTRETLSSFAPETSWSSWISSWIPSTPEASGLLVSSWTEGPGSHFLSSWMSGMSASGSELSHLSSLSSLSSWSSPPENLSSPSPPGHDARQLRTDIFLEGRTHPGVRIIIDGHPVPIQPDGSFRYHLAFGETGASCEAHLVTNAPNATESRRAKLQLDHKTDLVLETVHASKAP